MHHIMMKTSVFKTNIRFFVYIRNYKTVCGMTQNASYYDENKRKLTIFKFPIQQSSLSHLKTICCGNNAVTACHISDSHIRNSLSVVFLLFFIEFYIESVVFLL